MRPAHAPHSPRLPSLWGLAGLPLLVVLSFSACSNGDELTLDLELPMQTAALRTDNYPVVIDTFVRGSSAHENYGYSGNLEVVGATQTRSLVRFDDAAIGAMLDGREVLEAHVALEMNFGASQFPAGGGSVSAHGLPQLWHEKASDWRQGATWSCAHDTDLWNADLNCAPEDVWSMDPPTTFPAASGSMAVDNSTYTTINLDVTADLQAFAAGGGTGGLGWIVKLDDEAAGGFLRFFARESGTSPQLVITSDEFDGVCGDGVVQTAGGEACDDGNTAGGDGCSATCAVEVCGDGVVNNSGAEACDDGNTDDGDGCSAACVVEVCGDGIVNNTDEGCDDGNTTAGDGCTDCVVDVCGDGVLNNSGAEACDDGNTDDGDGCSAACVVEVCGDGIVNNTDEGCDDGNAVDGDGCTACVADTCGDGVVNNGGAEACDDGNAVDGDGCTACVVDTCGDGVVNNSDAETCDDGNAVAGDGCTACVVDVCGDGVVNNGGLETCDDGNTAPSDGCGPTCLIEGCGDGIVQAGEGCDDGNAVAGDGCSACVVDVCGDGVVNNAGAEACDDGNAVAGDGCTACVIDVCGDGVVNNAGAEACDDGNAVAGDGCSACVVDVCGDGVVNNGGAESCDDGNGVDGDGCTSCVVDVCGDGVVNNGGAEACDDGNAVADDGCTACVVDICGDGVVNNAGAEACDDGNAVDDDGCTACVVDTCGDGVVNNGGAESCDDGNAVDDDGCTSCVADVCGDGVVNNAGAEACDDGNAVADDGCTSCVVDVCGDGVVNNAGAEACDDGNTASDDGCSATCGLEGCGDGVVQAGEQCDDGNTTAGDGCSALCFDEGAACGADQYESAPPTGTTPRACTDLTVCTADEYESTAATATSDRVCTALTVCAANEVEVVAPTATSDRVCGLSIQTDTFSVARDTTLQEQSPNSALGYSNNLLVRGGSDVQRPVLTFDTDELLAALEGREVGMATLELEMNYGASELPAGGQLLGAHWLPFDIVEKSSDWREGATWNCAYDFDLWNSDFNCAPEDAWVMTGTTSFDPIATDAVLVENGDYRTLVFDVTADLAAFAEAPTDGASWMLMLEDEAAGGWVRAFAREGAVVPTLTVESAVAAAECGDGVVEDEEECDDGGLVDGDGCDAVCVIEVCGDGVLNNGPVNSPSGEYCDDGNTVSGDGCSDGCRIEDCGDGIVNNVDEECDDGGGVSGDGCSDACVIEFCGDGVLNNGPVNSPSGEYCDDGNTASGDGCSALCRVEFCGDGLVNNVDEECDDGGAVSGDGCSDACVIEFCGDGVVNNGPVNSPSGEYCDDGNTASGDGCSALCRVEFCGDGVVNNVDEECDDGNTLDGDGCEGDCSLPVGCGPDEWETSPGNCAPLTVCAAGEEELLPPTATSDRVCTPCAVGHYCAGGDSAPEPCAWLDHDRDPATPCSMVLSLRETCVLDSELGELCWDRGADPPLPAAPEQIVSWGRDIFLLQDGTIVTSASEPTPDNAAGPFTQLAVGDAANCAINDVGDVNCVQAGYSPPYWAPYSVPEDLGPSVSVATESYSSCAVLADGSVRCWGAGSEFPTSGGPYVEVDVGETGTGCAVTATGEVDCWSPSLAMRDVPVDLGVVTSVQVDELNACARTSTGDYRCWGRDADVLQPEVPLTEIWLGRRHLCGITLEGSLHCQGSVRTINYPKTRSYDLLASGDRVTCGVVSGTNQVECYGDILPAPDAFSASVVELAVGTRGACANLENGLVRCWDGAEAFTPDPSVGPVSSLAVGGGIVCAIDAAARVHCWSDGFPSGAVSQGPFAKVVAQDEAACGLLTNGEIECWGPGSLGAVPTWFPAGAIDLSVGVSKACAYWPDGAARCWGSSGVTSSFLGAPVPDDHQFAHGCYRFDNEVTCWDAPYTAPVPASPTIELTGEDTMYCLLGESGKVTCFGSAYNSGEGRVY